MTKILPKKPDYKGTDPLNGYAIIDCGHLEETFYQQVLKDDSLIAQSLFIDTPDEPSAAHGPLLVQLDNEKNQSFIERLQEIEEKLPTVLWLWSSLDFKRLANILKLLQYGELEDGTHVLVRYYDPRCFDELLKVFKTQVKIARKLTHIQGWALKRNNQYQYFS